MSVLLHVGEHSVKMNGWFFTLNLSMATARISLSPAPNTGPLQQSHLPWWQLHGVGEEQLRHYVLTPFTLEIAATVDSWWDIVWKPEEETSNGNLVPESKATIPICHVFVLG